MTTTHTHFLRKAKSTCAAVILTVAATGGPSASNAGHANERAAQTRPVAETTDWVTLAERSIASREYEATDSDSGLQAPNRAAEIRTYFDPSGVRVVDRRDDATELACLRTVGIGRGMARRLASGEVVAEGTRVEVRRQGVVEWYENSERGLEQGWTLAERPIGDGALTIVVDLGSATAKVDGDRATIASAGGHRLEYGGRSASDAAGTALATRMEATPSGDVRILVEDVDATYPITVDPVLTQPAFTTLMGDQASAAMGYSVAGAGDVNGDGYDDVIVGASIYDNGQTDEGAAFIYLGGPNGIASGGSASANARLEGNQAGAEFGVSVATAGDVNHDGYADVIVGALYYDSGQTNEGAAFVFLGGPNGIASGGPSTAATTLQSDQASATFGYSVASAGDVNDDGFSDVIVGAPDYSSGQTQEGGAFIFLGSASGIASGNPTTANTVLQSNQAVAGLGISVAGAGDTNGDGYDDVIAGARLYDAGFTDEGGAFVFLGGAGGIASGSLSSANATIRGGQAGANLGISVAGAGDVNSDGFDDVIIGANNWDASGTDKGIAVVFNGGPAGIASGATTEANTRLSPSQVAANFGISVAGAGDVNGDGYADVIVGAHLYNSGQTDEGAAFVFLGAPSGIPSDDFIEAHASALLQSDQDGARFGVSVAGLGDVNGDGFDDVAAGASSYDSGQTDEGAAFVYLGSRDGLSGFPAASASLEGNQSNAEMGFSVASAGDVNDDGYDDVIVGAPDYDNGQTVEGVAFLFRGGPVGVGNGSPANADTVLQSDQVNAAFGSSVAGAGDVNGDGYDDVIVGAPGYDSGQTDEGAAFVFFGGPAGVGNGSPSSADATVQSDQANARLGTSVAGAGDVNNDGYADVIIGAEFYTAGQTNEGAAFVFHGGPAGVGNGNPLSANASLQSDQASAGFGFSVAGAGDLNGDGYDDVVVGAYGYDAGQTDEGAAFVFDGGPAGVGNGSPSNADATLQSDHSNASLGFSVAGAGNINNDGYDDIIVGAPYYSAGQTLGGAAFVFLGGPTGVGNGNPSNADATLESDQAQGHLGYSVAGAGDVNGDGYDDVVVGSTASVAFPESYATAYVFLGSVSGIASGTPRTAAATLGRYYLTSSAFVSAAGAGDTNGDGFDDIIVGAKSYSHPESFEGGAFVYNFQRPAGAASGTDTVGIYVAASGAWFLKNANASGSADTVFTYGAGGGGYVPLRGDWDGDGDDTPGIYVPATGAFFLRNMSSAGGADIVFIYGAGGGGYVPIVGDWDGNGTDTVGLYAPTTSTFFLRNANAPGPADVTVGFGPAGTGWTPVAGDWDGNGTDTIGLYAPSTSTFFLRNVNAPGAADLAFGYGPANAGWKPVTGDFDGNGTDTVGLYSPSNGFFFLRNTNTPGAADLVFGYGPSNVTPLVGDWDGH